MPLENLVSVIETLKQRIQDHGDSLRQYETRFRMALIDPLLTALGWDVADPGLVTPEYVVENPAGANSRVDYALLETGGSPVAVVEAKRFEEQLAPHRRQLVDQAVATGINYAGLTDGDHWELYDISKSVPLEEKCILDVSIADTPAPELALKLLLLRRPNLAPSRPVAANELILSPLPTDEPPTPIPTPPARAIPAPTPTPTTTPPEGPGWTSLATWERPAPNSPPPTAIRFPDGSQLDLQRWHQLVGKTIPWLRERQWLKADNIPMKSGGKRYIFNTVPFHQSGASFIRPTKIDGTPLVYESNVSAKTAISYLLIMLEHCNVNRSDVYLQDRVGPQQ